MKNFKNMKKETKIAIVCGVLLFLYIAFRYFILPFFIYKRTSEIIVNEIGTSIKNRHAIIAFNDYFEEYKDKTECTGKEIKDIIQHTIDSNIDFSDDEEKTVSIFYNDVEYKTRDELKILRESIDNKYKYNIEIEYENEFVHNIYIK